MAKRNTVVGWCAVLLWAGSGVAGAQTAPSEEVLHRATDPVSGAEVRVLRGDGPHAAVEVAGAGVTVRKAVRGSGVETSIQTAGERLVVRVSPAGVEADGSAGPIVVRTGDRRAAERLMARLSGSPAVADALALLARVSHHPNAPIAQALFPTRMTLLTLSGDAAGAQRLGRTIGGTGHARLVPAVAQQGPGDCWDEYAAEAIEAYMEYEDCVDSEDWWDVPGLAICLGIYEVRAIGAFTWWMSCVGLRK